jgi:hypothetical protein
MAKKIMTVKSEIKRQLEFSIKQDGRADGGYYATLCKFRNEIGGTFNEFFTKSIQFILGTKKANTTTKNN